MRYSRKTSRSHIYLLNHVPVFALKAKLYCYKVELIYVAPEKTLFINFFIKTNKAADFYEVNKSLPPHV